ncbi:unnamed protein product [Urochloa humidicola]
MSAVPAITIKLPEHVPQTLDDYVRLLPHGDKSRALEALFEPLEHHISKCRLPGAGHPNNGDELELLGAGVHQNPGHLLHLPIETDEPICFDEERGHPGVNGPVRSGAGQRADAVALPLLAELNDALLDVLELVGDYVAEWESRYLVRAAAKPAKNPGAGGGRRAGGGGAAGGGVDADGEEVNPVLDVVGELADAADPGPGLGVRVLEGLAVVDGGAHAAELGLEEADIVADAGEERVLLLQQRAELPRQRIHHPRQSAHHEVHLAAALLGTGLRRIFDSAAGEERRGLAGVFAVWSWWW